MKRIPVNSLGFELTRAVPDSIEEYNALAPKRDNPVLEDATANILYRSTFAKFRDSFLEALEKQTSIKRRNNGTEKEPVWESDAKFLKRTIAELGVTEESFITQYQTLAQEQMDAAPFNPAERESTGEGPKVGKRDKEYAEELIKRGGDVASKTAAKLSTVLGRVVTTEIDSLARAVADFRRAKAKEREEQDRKELES